MTDLWEALKWGLWGFAIGFCFNPAIDLLRKVYAEFKVAREEWSRPRG